MIILFPHSRRDPSVADDEFVSECAAARAAGFITAFYDHLAVVKHQAIHVKLPSKISDIAGVALLRGWMLSAECYKAVGTALKELGLALVTSLNAYEEAHYLPCSYPLIALDTARSAWLEGDDIDSAWRLYQRFRANDAIIKDWVKSAKRRWLEGCFIPAGATQERFREIFTVFRSERGRLFNRGVVIREFMPIVTHGQDLRGLPIVDETRLFFWKGEILVRPTHRNPSPLNEVDRWRTIAQRFQTPFLAMDVAFLTDQSWKIVEVGAGEVSGLPNGLLPDQFYSALAAAVRI
jgi:hypothetical protein